MELKDKESPRPYVKGLDYLSHTFFPQERKVFLVELVVTGKVTAEEVCQKEGIPLGTFSSWCTKFLRAGRQRIRETVSRTPPIDAKHQIEVTLSEGYFTHIQETMQGDFFLSVTDVIEHALFLQIHFLKRQRARSEEDRRKFDERLEQLSEQAKAIGIYDTPEFHQLIANLYIGIDNAEEWAAFWDGRKLPNEK